MADNRVIIDFSVTGNGDVQINKVDKSIKELGKTAEQSLGKTTAAFAFVGAGILAAGATMVSLTKQALDAADQIGALAERVGVSTDFLQEMEFAASQLNIESGDLHQGLTVLNRTIGEASIGNEAAKKAFERLGISITNSNGKVKETNVIFDEAVRALEGIRSGSERAALAQDIFGKVGSKLAVIAAGGAGKLNELREEAHELGVVMNASLIKQADATNDRLSALSQTISKNLGTALITIAGPLMERAATALAKLAANAGKGAERITAMFSDANPQARAELLASSIELLNKKLEDTQKNVLQSPLKDSVIASTKEKIAELEAELTKLNPKVAETATNAEGAAAGFTAMTEAQQKLIDQGKALALKNDPTANAQAEVNALFAAREANVITEQQFLDTRQKIYEDANQKLSDMQMSQADLLIGENQRVLGDLTVANVQSIKDNDEKLKAMLKSEKLSAKDREKISHSLSESEKKIAQAKSQAIMGTLGAFSQFANAKNKELAAVGKAAAIAQTTINTYQAASLALATIPPPFGFIAAAANVAAGLLNVAQIGGVQLATGLSEVPPGYENDTFPARLSSGEGVIDKGTNVEVKAMAGSWPMVVGLLGGIYERLGALELHTTVNIGNKTIMDEVREGIQSGRVAYA